MTREEIEAMEPGRELDRLIRIHLFGDIDESWVWKEWWGEHWITDNKEVATWFELPKYSTDISAAWEVITKMKERNWWIALNAEYKEWNAMFYWDPHQQAYECGAETAPEAICKAALLAVLEG